MAERGILFSAPMVRALLAGTKTQTRRVVKPAGAHTLFQFRGTTAAAGADEPTGEWAWCGSEHVVHKHIRCPYGKPGDRLWVRETWAHHVQSQSATRCDAGPFVYAADHGAVQHRLGDRWRPAIHMFRWASRITLEIAGVRVERLQDISEQDAIAEGCEAEPFPGPWWQGYRDIGDGELIQQQAVGDAPPAWMVEPKPMRSLRHLDRSAKQGYRALWESINGAGSWDANPWVWVVEFRRLP